MQDQKSKKWHYSICFGNVQCHGDEGVREGRTDKVLLLIDEACQMAEHNTVPLLSWFINTAAPDPLRQTRM